MGKVNDAARVAKKTRKSTDKRKPKEEEEEDLNIDRASKDGSDKAENDSNSESEDDAPKQNDVDEEKTFSELGLIEPLCEACVSLKFTKPTPIQQQAIPYALEKKDIIGLAQTGSGKTAAFALPILQALYENPGPLFACVLAPTRELAYQISEQFEALGGGMGVRCVTIVGGMDMMSQAVALSKKPHIVVATPGRLVDHLENTKGFSFRTLKFLVMDEADRLLDMDFGPSIDKILKVIPRECHTYLFSATMTSKVEKLQRASLVNPVRVAVSTKYETVSSLLQYFVMVPFVNRDTYLVYLVNELAGQTMIIFARTCMDTQRISLILRQLGFASVPLHGQMSQASRLGALNKFKSGARSILVATDVAARGLDIPSVDCVINYDLPDDSKSYIHRVGRTARAGRAGKSIAIVTQYAIEQFLRIEKLVMNGEKMPSYPLDKEAVMLLHQRVGEAQREATIQLKDSLNQKKSKGKNQGIAGHRRKRRHGGDDAEEE